MYCSNCGSQVHGAYCSNCGTAVEGPIGGGNWHEETKFGNLIQNPKIREILTYYASQSEKRQSASEFLQRCDLVFRPSTGLSLELMAAVLVPFYSKIGIKTGKNRTWTFSLPVGKVTVAALSSMAWRAWPLKDVSQGRDGFVLEATVPSDLWSFEGTAVVGIAQTVSGASPSGTKVDAGIVIKGQLYDWGKSKKLLNRFFDDIEKIAGTL